ncbi:LysR family transcriptional regulator (plasmid) [Novosphingobium sp. BL-8A]|uniref:LysR family transcriptional regulator n=1 Tax=Novosphingobium sp. BL-8A TaxID=3127639 RepID=UPI0037564733
MRYKGLDLNLLHLLDVLLEVRNVTRAADRLALSQSAVSAALARLREFFGDELFVSDGRRMLPTAFAEKLARNLHQCLHEADTIINTGRDFDAATSTRTFRIIAADYIFASLLTDVSEVISKQAPGVRLDFITLDNDAPERMESGNIDLLIGPRQRLLPDHPSEQLFEEEIVVVGWSRNPMLANTLSTQDFFDAGHIAVRHGAPVDMTFGDRLIESAGHSRRIEAVAPSFTLVPWMLIGTSRLSLLPRHLADKLARYVPVKFVEPPLTLPRIPELAQFHRAKGADNGIRWLIEHIQKQVRSA